MSCLDLLINWQKERILTLVRGIREEKPSCDLTERPEDNTFSLFFIQFPILLAFQSWHSLWIRTLLICTAVHGILWVEKRRSKALWKWHLAPPPWLLSTLSSCGWVGIVIDSPTMGGPMYVGTKQRGRTQPTIQGGMVGPDVRGGCFILNRSYLG